MAISFNFSPTSSHLHPLQVENCNSNSRLVVDEYDNGKFRLEKVNLATFLCNDEPIPRIFFCLLDNPISKNMALNIATCHSVMLKDQMQHIVKL